MNLSIITATYNAMGYLPELVESLNSQSCKNYEWIVVDGGSDDGTVHYLSQIEIEGVDVRIISEPDFGIYDALNKGIRFSSFEYYLVIGCDDVLYKDSVANYDRCLKDGIDIVTADVKYNGTLHSPRKKIFSFMDDAWSFVSCHSVGCVFRKSLHDEFGFYSKRFPIAADQYFIKKAISAGVKVHYAQFVAGEFGSDGVSSTDVLGHLSETFRIQYETENQRWIQFLMFGIRLLKNKFIGKF